MECPAALLPAPRGHCPLPSFQVAGRRLCKAGHACSEPGAPWSSAEGSPQLGVACVSLLNKHSQTLFCWVYVLTGWKLDQKRF